MRLLIAFQIWVFSVLLLFGLTACLPTTIASRSLQAINENYYIENPAVNKLNKRNQQGLLACFGKHHNLCNDCQCTDNQVTNCGSTAGEGLAEHPISEGFCRRPEFGGCVCGSQTDVEQALNVQQIWSNYWSLPEGRGRDTAGIDIKVVRAAMMLPPPPSVEALGANMQRQLGL